MASPFDPLSLVRPGLRHLAGYVPVEPTEVIAGRHGVSPAEILKLDGNENPFGPSPKAREALAAYDAYHIYPDPNQTALRRALSEYVGVSDEYIIAGHGSDEIIDLLLRAILSPGDAVIDCPPTFGMYRFSTEVCGGRVLEAPRRDDFSLDVDAVRTLAPQAKAVFVASPNNPSGNILPAADLDALLATGLLVVLDEAYVEFHGESVVRQVPDRPNLVVLRTFSKWAGLAGLRAGFGVMAPPLAALLMQIKPPYTPNVAATAAVLASLADRDRLLEGVRVVVEERERLREMLAALPFVTVYPSRANFLLCRLEGLDARQVRDRLRQRGIFVRHFDTPLLKHYLRISIGRPQQSEPLIRALREVGAELGQ